VSTDSVSFIPGPSCRSPIFAVSAAVTCSLPELISDLGKFSMTASILANSEGICASATRPERPVSWPPCQQILSRPMLRAQFRVCIGRQAHG
jgi:hypothetical protein